MQSAFVDIGLERDAFLYVTDFLEEQDEGADFDAAGGNGQRARREGGRDIIREGQESYARARQPEAGGEAESVEEPARESQDSESPSGTRRWRGRRGRRRGFRSRGPHEERPQLESPAAVEESISAEPVVIPEHGAPGGVPATNRILLPGESLSKYGSTPAPEAKVEAKPEASAQVAAVRSNYSAPKPSTLIEKPIEWDGGLILAGESLSRYRGRTPAEPVEPSVAETAGFETEAESRAPEAAAAVAEDEAHVAVQQGRVEP
ncbi:MAG: hypothetical protein JO347_04135 [Candidatus Eremiobacteraeota bacterium]|nr:hypothetical protein [Candidatus Eremiobacteraeota bacterium]